MAFPIGAAAVVVAYMVGSVNRKRNLAILQRNDATTVLPIQGARLQIIGSRPPEGMLRLPGHGGVIVSGDCLQNWGTVDPYFNGVGRVMMRWMGFIRPHNIGPAWLRQGKPPKEHLRAILDSPFAHVLPAHGAPVIGNATELYRAAIDRVAPAAP